jgi:hypothetical protein
MIAKIRIRNNKTPLCGDPMFGHKLISNSLGIMPKQVIEKVHKKITPFHCGIAHHIHG